MTDDRLLLFLARHDVELGTYDPSPQFSSYIHCIREFINARHSVNVNQLVDICWSMVREIQRRKPEQVLAVFEHTDDNDGDDELSSSENGNDSDSENEVENQQIEIQDSIMNLANFVDHRLWCNIEFQERAVRMWTNGHAKDFAMLFIVDNRFEGDVAQLIKDHAAKLKPVTAVSENDTFNLNTTMNATQLRACVPAEIDPSMPVFYPQQISAAELIIKRIQFVLRHYHGVELEDYKEFDFRIYTARSKMLEKQTVNRLCDKRAECFKPNVYNDRCLLKQHAEQRVRKYVFKNETKQELENLKNDAMQNPRKLFLIVADEAHWGTSKKPAIGESANSTFVNMWTDEYPNVIVLLVTATPWNLLTENSRLFALNVAERLDTHELIEVEERRHHRLFNDGNDVTSDVGSKKELHIIKWNETLDSFLAKGLVVNLRVPQRTGDEPIWLCVSRECSDEMYSWCGCQNANEVTPILLQSIDNNHIQITTADGSKTLVVRNNLVGFMQQAAIDSLRQSSNGGEIRTTFKLCTDFNEYIVEFLSVSARDETYLYFDSAERSVSGEYCGKVKLFRSRPADNRINHVSLVYHTLHYSFFMEAQHQLKKPEQKQYLSLNFYYNSMRNNEPTNRLIRKDDFFQRMVRMLRRQPDDILAAEYAYYILIINHVRSLRLEHISEILQRMMNSYSPEDIVNKFNPFYKNYLLEKATTIDEMTGRLPEHRPSFELQQRQINLHPVEKHAFSSVVQFISDEALKQWRTCVNRLKSKKNVSDDDVDEFLRKFVCYCIHAEKSSFNINLRDAGQAMGKDKLQRVKQRLDSTDSTDFRAVLTNSLSDSETYRIVDDLIVKELPADGEGIRGHMKVIRASDKASGNVLYETLALARRIGSKEKQYFFEVLRYFDKLDISKHEKSIPVRRIWQVMQRHRCEFEDAKTYYSCPCDSYNPAEDRVACSNCRHEHRQISQFSDLDRLPCIVILVERGRMGDTFPPSFNAMDLRVRSQKAVPSMSSMMQELGRLCRYQNKPIDGDYSELPYVLVSPKVVDCFSDALIRGAPIYCAYENHPIDARCNRAVRKKKSQTAAMPEEEDYGTPNDENTVLTASRRHYDHGNTEKHSNRLLFQAEPQIGKTGVYLKTISLLRKRIEREMDQTFEENQLVEKNQLIDEDKPVPADLYEEYVSSDSDDDNGETSDMTEFPYWGDMRVGELKTVLGKSKYSALFGEYNHGRQPKPLKIGSVIHTANQKRKFEEISLGSDQSRTEYRTFSFAEHKECVTCQSTATLKRFYYILNKQDNCTMTISSKRPPKDPIFYRITVPRLSRFNPLTKKLRKHKNGVSGERSGSREQTCSRQTRNDGRLVLKTWIFNPSYGRANDACVNYAHTMTNENNDCNYVQILVVRPEEREDYAACWRTTHAILELPHTMPDCDTVDVNTGGIGYARRFIQLFAELLDLERIFVIDDNIYKIYEPSVRYDLKDEQQPRMANVSLFAVLHQMESQFDCWTPLKERQRKAYDATKECECLKDSDVKECNRLHQYTGPNSNYAVLGIRKYRQKCNQPTSAFKKTHVFSLVLLNVDVLKQNGIRYQPWQVHEDCNLNNDCDQNGLTVCKYNRFMMTKRFLTPWLPQVFEWKDDTKLNTSLDLQIAEMSGCKILKWIRQVAPPRQLNFVAKGILVDLSNVKSSFLKKLMNTCHGKAHIVVFADGVMSSDDIEKFNDNSEIMRTVGVEEGIQWFNDTVQRYFENTPGIGGFDTHVVLLHTPLCINCRLTSFEYISGKLVERLFMPLPSSSPDSSPDFQIVTSHNVDEFRVPFVAVLIRGKIKNAKDEGKLANVGMEFTLEKNSAANGFTAHTDTAAGHASKRSHESADADDDDDVSTDDDDASPPLAKRLTSDCQQKKDGIITSADPSRHGQCSDVEMCDEPSTPQRPPKRSKLVGNMAPTSSQQPVEKLYSATGTFRLSDLIILNTRTGKNRPFRHPDDLQADDVLQLSLQSRDDGSIGKSIIDEITNDQ